MLARRCPATAGGLLAAAVLAASVLTPAAAAGPATADTTSHIGLFAQDWNGAANSRTQAQWQTVATTHDVLVGRGKSYAAEIPQLHGWNPSLRVLVYDLGPYTVQGSPEYTTLMSQHPDYFARDANGNLITVVAAAASPSFPKNTLMDWSNPGWQSEHAQRVLSEVTQGGWDGAYLDSMGLGALSAPPIDRATGQPYTALQWATAGAADLNAVKAVLGSTRYLMCTGLINGLNYTSATHALAQSNVDGLMTDSWLRLSTRPLTWHPSQAELQSNLDMVTALQAAGKGFYGWTKVWVSATQQQLQAWNDYALAAYLLVRAASAYYDFTPGGPSTDRTQIPFADEQAALGAPLGAYTVSGSVYQRSFEHGTVTLNASTGVGTITVTP